MRNNDDTTPQPFNVPDLFYRIIDCLSLKDIASLAQTNSRMRKLRDETRDHSIGEHSIMQRQLVPQWKLRFVDCIDLSFCFNQLHHEQEFETQRNALKSCDMNLRNSQIIIAIPGLEIIFCSKTGNHLSNHVIQMNGVLQFKESKTQKVDGFYYAEQIIHQQTFQCEFNEGKLLIQHNDKPLHHISIEQTDCEVIGLCFQRDQVYLAFINSENQVAIQKYPVSLHKILWPGNNPAGLFKPASQTAAEDPDDFLKTVPSMRKRERW